MTELSDYTMEPDEPEPEYRDTGDADDEPTAQEPPADPPATPTQ